MPGTIDVARFREAYSGLKRRMEAFRDVAEAFEIDLEGNGHEEAGPTLVLVPAETPATVTVAPKPRRAQSQPVQRGGVTEAVGQALREASQPMNAGQIQQVLAVRGLSAPKASVKSALGRIPGVTRPSRGLYELKVAPSKDPNPATVTAYNQGFAAPPGTECMYAEGTPHRLAWEEGHRDADKRRRG